MEDLNHLLSEKKNLVGKLKKNQSIIGWLRVAVFLALSFFLVKYYILESAIIYHLYFAIFCIVLFFALGFILVNVKQKLLFNKNFLHIGGEIKQKTEFDTGLEFEEHIDDHYFANDLDILGKNSLFSHLSYCETLLGKNKLKDFFLKLTLDPIEIKDKQKAISELSNKTEWNIHFLTLAKNLNIKESIKHPESSGDVFGNALLAKIAVILVPILTISLVIAMFVINIPGLYLGLMFGSILILARIVFYIYDKKIAKISDTLSFNSEQYEQFLSVFSLIENENFEQKLNVKLQGKFNSGKSKSSRKEIEKLSRLLRNYESGFSNIGLILNNFFLWRLNFALRIDQQVKNIEQDLPQWFEAFAEFEALISLAIFKYKNPDYIFPELSTTDEKLHADKIVHPLLFQKNVVSNDFDIAKNTDICIITGANMTGKSTFLRTVGINLVLAMNGCPVSAKKFSFKPMNIFTSMRTSDSLNDGTSYFNAEILRLRSLIENLDSGKPQFIILDEILKGTNSQDKLTGSELFLEKLLKSETLLTCLIATHDLDLTKIEQKFPEKIKNYCFELENRDGELLTNYKLQNGVTKSMNALYLMRKFGIIE